MDPVQAILIVAGESPCVLELADGRLEGHVRQRYSIGTMPNGEPLEQNVVIVEIPTSADDDDSALNTVMNWLNRHRAALTQCDADKTLELRTYLQPDTGSRILKMPNSLIQIAAELGLNIANQAIRILTEDEFGKLGR